MPTRASPALRRERPCRRCGATTGQQVRDRGRSYWRCGVCKAAAARRWTQKTKGDVIRQLHRSAQWRARQLGLPFTITREDVQAAWPLDGRCPALGLRLERGREKSQDASPTLDRLNGAWGYVPGNIAVISLAANRAKGNSTAEQLERIAAWMRGRGLR